MPDETRDIDCLLLGSCVVDVLVRPFDLDHPIGHGTFHRVAPIQAVPGGLTANAGITLARMGKRITLITRLGNDPWARLLLSMFADEAIDASCIDLVDHHHTSATVVTIDPTGERSFFHCGGAHRTLTIDDYLAHSELFARSRAMLWGYYPLADELIGELPRLFSAAREAGCLTAMDCSGDGGTMSPLEAILPHVDVFVPSHLEASNQTGEKDPRKMIDVYRGCGAPGIVGVKLGAEGVLLSDAPGSFTHVACCPPPGPVVDTTGAGDSFYAGLIAGLLDGLSLHDAGRLGCAAGACCITAPGGSTAARSMDELKRIAGLTSAHRSPTRPATRGRRR